MIRNWLLMRLMNGYTIRMKETGSWLGWKTREPDPTLPQALRRWAIGKLSQ